MVKILLHSFFDYLLFTFLNYMLSSKDNFKWSNESALQLIELHCNKPVLWVSKNPNYNNTISLVNMMLGKN